IPPAATWKDSYSFLLINAATTYWYQNIHKKICPANSQGRQKCLGQIYAIFYSIKFKILNSTKMPTSSVFERTDCGKEIALNTTREKLYSLTVKSLLCL